MSGAPGVDELQKMLDGAEFTSAYGFRIRTVGGGEAVIAVPFMKRWERPGGIVSGQVYMNAADCAMWVAILGSYGPGPMTVTTQLDTAFIAPAREEEITCTARVVRNGRRLIYGTAECHGGDGRLLSQHMLTYARAEA